MKLYYLSFIALAGVSAIAGCKQDEVSSSTKQDEVYVEEEADTNAEFETVYPQPDAPVVEPSVGPDAQSIASNSGQPITPDNSQLASISAATSKWFYWCDLIGFEGESQGAYLMGPFDTEEACKNDPNQFSCRGGKGGACHQKERDPGPDGSL